MTEIDLTVYPDECDAFGHLNQASFLRLFERARWEMLFRTAGMDVFSRQGVWPAVRKTTIDYNAPAFPGDVLRFQQAVTHRGRTSFTMRQSAKRVADDTLVATAEFVFVCIDRGGRPVPVPDEVGRSIGQQGEPSPAKRMTVNGVSIAYDDEGDGTPVLFIHGFPLNRTLWADQVRHLTGVRRIAPDLRGFGASDAPDLGYSMTTYAEDLAALLDALGVEQVILVGLSMGGYIAFEFARLYRERITGLVLMDTRAEADSSEVRKGREVLATAARDRGTTVVADAMLSRMFAPGAPERIPGVVAQVRTMMELSPVPGIVGALSAMKERPDSTSLLPMLAGIPTLVLCGEDDAMIPPEVHRAMAGMIPGAVYDVVPGAGHLPPVEEPGATTRALQEWLGMLGKG